MHFDSRVVARAANFCARMVNSSVMNSWLLAAINFCMREDEPGASESNPNPFAPLFMALASRPLTLLGLLIQWLVWVPVGIVWAFFHAIFTIVKSVIVSLISIVIIFGSLFAAVKFGKPEAASEY